MLRNLQLTLPFRGERTYLHGTDLYQAVLAALGDARPQGPVGFTFHSLLQCQPDLICASQSLRHLREDPRFRGELTFGSGEAQHHAVLMESDRPVTERKTCNEPQVAAAAMVDETARTATLHTPQAGLPIEQVVFLNKHLHLHLLPQLSPKWLFARLELREALPSTLPGELTVALRQVLANRFTRSDVLIDGQRFGSISFSTPQ